VLPSADDKQIIQSVQLSDATQLAIYTQGTRTETRKIRRCYLQICTLQAHDNCFFLPTRLLVEWWCNK